MVFSINAKFEGERTMAQFKQLAIQKNGTEQAPLAPAGIQIVDPGAEAAPSTVTVEAGPGAVATHPPPMASHPPPVDEVVTHSQAVEGGVPTHTQVGGVAPSATVVVGEGKTAQGDACACQCLCGMNAFPPQAAINNFGGFAGAITNGRA